MNNQNTKQKIINDLSKIALENKITISTKYNNSDIVVRYIEAIRAIDRFSPHKVMIEELELKKSEYADWGDEFHIYYKIPINFDDIKRQSIKVQNEYNILGLRIRQDKIVVFYKEGDQIKELIDILTPLCKNIECKQIN